MFNLLFALPIIVFFITIIIVFVTFSDSNKHLYKLDTQSKIKLEKLRSEVINNIKTKSNDGNKINIKSIVENDLKKQNEFLSSIKKQKDTNITTNVRSCKKNIKQKDYSNQVFNEKLEKKSSISKLEINSENLVRAIIAKEYLYKKIKRRV